MNKKQTIKLNESQLRRIVKESVKRVISEQNIVTREKANYEKALTVKKLKEILNTCADDEIVRISINGQNCLACHVQSGLDNVIIQGSSMNFPDEEIIYQNDDVKKAHQRERNFLLNKDYDLK